MIRIEDKSKCSGCGACAGHCPANAISMEADSEGFQYPHVNETLCTECRLCERICPVLNREAEEPRPQWAWIAQHQNKDTLNECTSGGVFSAIAESALENGGVVYGVALDKNFRAVHRAVRDKADLPSLRGSKYVQSDTGDTFREAEKDLKSGRFVVYSGTPCQIEGFRRFLGVDYPNLLLVDVVCHAVPSPMIWTKYVESLKASYGDIEACYFRDKRPYGYQMSVLSAYRGSRQVYRGDISVNPYLRAFFSDLSDRPSCYDCKFKKRWRVSDLTVWDCFNPCAFMRKNEQAFGWGQTGVSCALAQSEKGRKAVVDANLRLHSVDADTLCASAKEMTRSVSINERRGDFFRDAEVLNGQALFQKWFPVRLKNRLEHAVRVALACTGLTVPVRALAKKVVRHHKR